MTDLAAHGVRIGRWAAHVVAPAPVVGTPARRPGIGDPIRAVRNRAGAPHDVLLLASGNLALLSFLSWPGRLSFEEISAQFPRLIPGLVNQEGIAFVLVTSSVHGAMVLGPTGTMYLDDDRIEGNDPLAGFGPHADRHLRRQSLFTNLPDIVINSTCDPTTGDVLTFEETIGSHGGLGGTQARPFLLAPRGLDPGPGQIVGACALHDVFVRWRRELAAGSMLVVDLHSRAATSPTFVSARSGALR